VAADVGRAHHAHGDADAGAGGDRLASDAVQKLLWAAYCPLRSSFTLIDCLDCHDFFDPSSGKSNI
jgi:hypothetical protein